MGALSVILSSYKGNDKSTLVSWLNQDVVEMEIVLLLPRLNLRTQLELWLSDRRIKWVATKNLTSLELMQRALQTATGQYLIFVENPAALDLKRVAQQVALMDAHPKAAVCIGDEAAQLDGTLQAAGFSAAEDIVPYVLAQNLTPPASLLFRRSPQDKTPTSRGNTCPDSFITPQSCSRLKLGTALALPLQGPEYIQIGPSDACNSRCLFCYEHSPLITATMGDRPRHTVTARQEGKLRMLQYEAWARCIDDLAALGTPRIDYVGLGEPLLHPDIDRALYYGHPRLQQNMFTNGFLLKDHLAAVGATISSLTISLNAATEKTHTQVHHCRPEVFPRILEAISELRRQSARCPSIHLSYVVNRLNFREIPLLAQLSRDLDVTAHLVPLGTYPETEPVLGLAPGEQDELFALMDELEKTPGHRVANIPHYRAFMDRDSSCIVKRLPCYVGMIFAQVRGDGDVAFCCAGSRILGNIHTQSFSEIWDSAKYRQARRAALTAIVRTQKPLPGCHCFICGFAMESLRIHNQIHGTVHSLQSLKASAQMVPQR